MAIPLTGTAGLFTRLGRIIKTIAQINTNQSGSVATDIQLIADEFETDRLLVDTLQTQLVNHQDSMLSLASYLQQLAQNTIIDMVNEAEPVSAGSLSEAIQILIDQMEADGDTVDFNTVTSSIAAWAGNNAADAEVITSLYNVRGLPLQNVYAEEVKLTVTTDSQEGAVSAGSELAIAAGEIAENSTLNYTWPLGSGCNTGVTFVNAELDNSGGNLLTNGSFSSFDEDDTDQADNWVYEVGQGGIDILSTEGTGTAGSLSGGCVSDGSIIFNNNVNPAVLPCISQTFNSTTGTAGKLKPLSQYAFNFYVAADSSPSGGTLVVELVDENDAVIQDENGSNNQYTLSAHLNITTSCSTVSGVFRTPRVLPSSIRFRIRVGSAITAHTMISIDHVAFTEMVELYPFGPSVAAFSGLYAVSREDYWLLTFTNDRNGLWGTWFEQLFGTNSLRLRLPTESGATAGTIAESLLQ